MSPRILNDHELVVVDDDEMELILTERYLRKSRVTNPLLTFTSGEGFLDYLESVERGEKRMPALVLMDVRMPTIDGFDIVSQVRKRPAFATLPFIMMFSNSDSPSDMRRSREAGADHYQVKPTSGEQFVAFLDSLV